MIICEPATSAGEHEVQSLEMLFSCQMGPVIFISLFTDAATTIFSDIQVTVQKA